MCTPSVEDDDFDDDADLPASCSVALGARLKAQMRLCVKQHENFAGASSAPPLP
eukprot:CAMPEP_0206125964 /NCGR_PEP_ID=MMETSP1472-20131121/19793_1 /ASSEMBLY_ACC=CAM_ASM_001108 /TAXON_ID=41880 /ORGANISM="Pycnococcus provasolii, Strain RCC251" /LENGTH=53 /DNA_ID=CAMNT_0053516937 /DNA_START=241 /DNA_END=398 /DNA_ORIENTATION=-